MRWAILPGSRIKGKKGSVLESLEESRKAEVEVENSRQNNGNDRDDDLSMSNPAAPFVFDTGTRRFYHGTRADLKPGDLLQPGYSSNYAERRSPWIYFSETLHAATWGAELAKGEGPGESIWWNRPGRLWMTQI
jgi:hypothetical protein